MKIVGLAMVVVLLFATAGNVSEVKAQSKLPKRSEQKKKKDLPPYNPQPEKDSAADEEDWPEWQISLSEQACSVMTAQQVGVEEIKESGSNKVVDRNLVFGKEEVGKQKLNLLKYKGGAVRSVVINAAGRDTLVVLLAVEFSDQQRLVILLSEKGKITGIKDMVLPVP